MIILVSLKRRTAVFFISILLICCGLGIYLFHHTKIQSVAVVDDETEEKLEEDLQQVFDLRNKTLLEQDQVLLATLYDTNVTYGEWAYAHELKKMKYLENWSVKQGVNFIDVGSEVKVRWANEKGDGYTLNLLVSTEYKYKYDGMEETIHSFRIGTYHSLDIKPLNDQWVITREWYTDPFADSLHLDKMVNTEVRAVILAGEMKQHVDLNDRRKKALEYLDQYCGAASLPEYGYKYNPKYRDYNPQGGDCANFTSQMLYEGGGFQKNRTWNYERGSGSKAWVNAHAFNQYMVYSGRASLIARGSYEQVLRPSYKLLPGDYVAYEKKGEVKHISIVSGVDSKGYVLVNSHNSDRYRVPWDLGWSNDEIRFWLVRVQY